MTITNIHYKKFLKENIMDYLTEDQIDQALNNVTGKHRLEGRALLITLYYTGARPNEVLRLYGRDIKKVGSYVVLQVPASKSGLPRPISLQSKIGKVQELYKFAMGSYPDLYLFPNYQSKYIRKDKVEISNSLRYHFNKWFKGVFEVPPYYLRHNRFSSLMVEGCTQEEVRFLKGGKTLASVTPYLHFSTAESKKLAKKIK